MLQLITFKPYHNLQGSQTTTLLTTLRLSLSHIIIYRALKQYMQGITLLLCLSHIIIYRALKPELKIENGSLGLSHIIIYRALKPQIAVLTELFYLVNSVDYDIPRH